MNGKLKFFRSFFCRSLIFFIFCNTFCFAETQGEKLFKSNKPQEAAVLLEDEIKSGKASKSAYIYLGLCYFQLDEYEKAVDAFSRGMNVSGTNKKVLAYNKGNALYKLQKYDEAIKSYSLALTADTTYYVALLNRANANLMADNIDAALEDYKKYIIVVPDDLQKPEIERLIALLTKESERRAEEEKIALAEAERLAEEEKRMAEELERQRIEAEKLAEEQRRIEEAKRAEEAERRRKILEDVAASLHNTDSTNMSSGAEELIDYKQESELD